VYSCWRSKEGPAVGCWFLEPPGVDTADLSCCTARLLLLRIDTVILAVSNSSQAVATSVYRTVHVHSQKMSIYRS
jgi:hypothetical protein